MNWTSNELAERIAGNPSLKLKSQNPLAPRQGEAPAKRGTQRVESTAGPRSFIVPGAPVAKPRQTRSDKWKKRPCVVKYREWADKARRCMYVSIGTVSITAGSLDVVAYFPLRKGLSERMRAAMQGFVHMSKPDADNVLKAVADSLCKNDQMIYDMSIKKRWDDGNGPRVEITVR